ncbi:MAG: HlyC/CorC family transporter [Lachnospiraceae bacterium]|nr:HlyC/CorC family transporter [Lachnospiraceae bacterium]
MDIGRLFKRVIGKDSEENVTEQDIISVINEGHEHGVLLASEAEMINNIVEFGDKEAKDIMTHRKNIVAVNGDNTLNEVAEYIVKQNNSRFPVYQGDIDNIIGIVNFRDVMIESSKKRNNDKSICEIDNLVRKAIYIPETKKINVLFKMMQSEKMHMVVVIDEYGQTAGIVAMEDILEEIVGNILDEYDEEDTDIVKKEDGSFIVRGTTSLDEISDETGITFDEDCETLNGYLTTKFERILSNEERPELVINNVKFKILNVENKVISLVHISIIDEVKEA